jgi:hypothetical protein
MNISMGDIYPTEAQNTAPKAERPGATRTLFKNRMHHSVPTGAEQSDSLSDGG